MGALLFCASTGVIKVVEKPEPPSWYVEQSDPTVPTWFLCHELGLAHGIPAYGEKGPGPSLAWRRITDFCNNGPCRQLGGA